jgi:DNA repair protein RadD
MSLVLRPYQELAIEGLRQGVRDGHRKQILYAATGAGKTVVATKLTQEARDKGSRAVFAVDRVALVDQTSAMFDQYGIDHGVMQGDHWRRRPWERIQVASAQTLARRGVLDEVQLLVVDEAHVIHKSVLELIQRPDLIVVGLTATPFTKGLGKLFTNVVNVTTTDRLIADGWLAPLKVYAAKQLDMTGARTKFDGEWADDEMETRGLTIVGDVVTEWVKQTQQHFNGPAKTLVFSATVHHGEEICRQFQEQGYNFQQVSYKDGNDDRRRALIEEFRKADSEIVGLVSCEALSKGFDVPDVKVGISARPYRKSLSGHIQQIGRLMRPSEGKDFALLLDHAGNFLRFRSDMERVFAEGVSDLSKADFDSKVRKEPDEKERELYLCGGCKAVMRASAAHCPACGWERPKRISEVLNLPGQLVEVGKREMPGWMQDKESVWRQMCGLALERKNGDMEAAERFARAQYKSLYQQWPRYAMRNITPEIPSEPVRRKVQQQLIAFFRSRKATSGASA